MKRKNILILLFIWIALLASAITVSATTFGDQTAIGGFNSGYVILAFGLLIAVVGAIAKVAGVLGSKGVKIFIIVVLTFVVIGVPIAFVPITPTTTDITGDCPAFTVTGKAVTSGTDYITTVNWDEDEDLFTIPITVADSSDGNLSGHKTAINFTLDPTSTSDYLSTTMATIYMKCDYKVQYGGEDIFSKTGNYYDVNWTTPSGTESYDTLEDMQISDESWALLSFEFNNGTAGNWVTELGAVGQSITWYITFWTPCGSQIDSRPTITVTATVVSYTA